MTVLIASFATITHAEPPIAFTVAQPNRSDTGVTPSVQDWQPASGEFSLSSDKVVISVNAKDETALAVVAAEVKDQLTAEGFHSVEIVSSDKPARGSIFLSLAATPLDHGAEAYTLEIGSAAAITGNSPAAVLYGTQSLLQMRMAHGGAVPRGVVHDWPAYARRMLMLDVGRKPWPLSAIKDYVRLLAWHKMNELHLHLSDTAFSDGYCAERVQSEVFPGLCATDLSYSKKEIRELVAFAEGHGVTITPEFDMPGHATAFTNYFKDCMLPGHREYLDVSNSKTLQVMTKFVDEMIPLFDAPDFHIGTDEYRVGNPVTNKKAETLHEDFRKFINAMNAHIRSRGKNCRIWSGFESMGGRSVKIDPTVIIDLWDPYTDEDNGHRVINSDQGRTYICPGCHYYGIEPAWLYDHWVPWHSGDDPQMPRQGDPRFLGAKLNVWSDQGPTGYTMTEIADVTLPGIQSISEKLWGTKSSPRYSAFKKRASKILPVPGVTVFDRLQIAETTRGSGVVLDVPEEMTIANINTSIPLPLAKVERADLEYPWTMSLQAQKTKDDQNRGVLLSSDLVEICANYLHKEKKRNTPVTSAGLRGLGLVRAAGCRSGSGSAAETYLAGDVSQSFGNAPEVGKWTTITVVGDKAETSIYIDGRKIGTSNNQMVCPLRFVGSTHGQSFVGKVRKLKVWNRVLSDEAIANPQIANAVDVTAAQNVASGCAVSASASDSENGLVPENVTDEDSSSRWSSGVGGVQWLVIDLGAEKSVTGTDITWEAAYAKQYTIEVSSDQSRWKQVYAGEGNAGKTVENFAPVRARYIRLNLQKAATVWGYSIYDVEVYSGK